MSPSKRFKPVQRVAESRERTAAHRLGDSQRNQREQEGKLDELRRYHREYSERFDAVARNGINATRLREFQSFISRLELAIKEQENIVLASRHDCAAKREEWKKKRVRSKALDKVVERCEATERQAESAREQKESDDRSQRGGRR